MPSYSFSLISIALPILLLLTGCSTATIIPMSNGQYQIVASGSSAEEAKSRALRKASEECDGNLVKIVSENAAPESGSDRAKNYFNGGLVGLGSNLYEASLQFTCSTDDASSK